MSDYIDKNYAIKYILKKKLKMSPPSAQIAQHHFWFKVQERRNCMEIRSGHFTYLFCHT